MLREGLQGSFDGFAAAVRVLRCFKQHIYKIPEESGEGCWRRKFACRYLSSF